MTCGHPRLPPGDEELPLQPVGQLVGPRNEVRYWICDISNPASESRFEIDFDEPPAEGSVIAPGRMVYKVTAVVRLASEKSPGVIEVTRITNRRQHPL